MKNIILLLLIPLLLLSCKEEEQDVVLYDIAFTMQVTILCFIILSLLMV